MQVFSGKNVSYIAFFLLFMSIFSQLSAALRIASGYRQESNTSGEPAEDPRNTHPLRLHDAGVCIVGDNPAARLSFGHPVGGPSTRVGGELAPRGSLSLLWGSLSLLVAWSVRITGRWPLSAGPWGCFRVLASFVRRSRRLLCAFFWFAPSPPLGPPFLFPPW